MRFKPEALHGANNGLAIARGILEPLKKEFSWISYGDLWTLAGVAAIQVGSGVIGWLCEFLLRHSPHRKPEDPRSHGEPDALMDSKNTLLPMDAYQMLLRVATTFGTSSIAWGG